MISAEFTYTLDDFLALQKAWEARQRFARFAKPVLWGFSWVAFFVFFLVSFQHVKDGGSLSGLPWVYLVLGILGLFFVMYLYPRRIRRSYANQLIDGKTFKVTLDDVGVHLIGPDMSVDYNWAGLLEFQNAPDHYFFWINNVQSVSIPKRVLADVAAGEAIERFARDHMPQKV